MIIDNKPREYAFGAIHPLAGTYLLLGTQVYRYNNVGGTELVASCISPEAATAAHRLLSK